MSAEDECRKEFEEKCKFMQANNVTSIRASGKSMKAVDAQGTPITLDSCALALQNLLCHKFQHRTIEFDPKGGEDRLEIDILYPSPITILPEDEVSGVLVVNDDGAPFLIAFRAESLSVNPFHHAYVSSRMERDLRTMKKAVIRETAGQAFREYVVPIRHCLE